MKESNFESENVYDCVLWVWGGAPNVDFGREKIHERFVERWILGLAVMEGRYVLAKLNACWEL